MAAEFSSSSPSSPLKKSEKGARRSTGEELEDQGSYPKATHGIFPVVNVMTTSDATGLLSHMLVAEAPDQVSAPPASEPLNTVGLVIMAMFWASSSSFRSGLVDMVV